MKQTQDNMINDDHESNITTDDHESNITTDDHESNITTDDQDNNKVDVAQEKRRWSIRKDEINLKRRQSYLVDPTRIRNRNKERTIEILHQNGKE